MTELVIRPLSEGEEPLRRRAGRLRRAMPRPSGTGDRLPRCPAGTARHGYADELPAEATHLLIAEGADRIVAATGVTNTPMAAAFEKARYSVFQHRIEFVPPSSGRGIDE